MPRTETVVELTRDLRAAIDITRASPCVCANATRAIARVRARTHHQACASAQCGAAQ